MTASPDARRPGIREARTSPVSPALRMGGRRGAPRRALVAAILPANKAKPKHDTLEESSLSALVLQYSAGLSTGCLWKSCSNIRVRAGSVAHTIISKTEWRGHSKSGKSRAAVESRKTLRCIEHLVVRGILPGYWSSLRF